MQALLIDALDRLHQCPTQEARWACGVGLLRDCGSDWMTAGTASRHAQTALAIRSTTPESLMCDYVAERIYLDDPWMQLCASTSAPDHLEVDAETGPTGRPEKTRMSRLFSDHGIKRAVLVPCYGGDRPGGIVLYAKSASAADWLGCPEGLLQARLLIAVLSSQYRPEQDRSASPQLYAVGNALSAREREVLQWLFAGHRTTRIAERMGVEDVTVTKHLQSARRKLGARTREQALAIAIRDGLISV